MYPGDLHDLTKWAINRRNVDSYGVPPAYQEYIESLIPDKRKHVIGHHLNFYTPMTPTDESGQWVRGYPHSHVWSVNWPPETFSVLTYLAVAEEGGEFALGGLERNDPYEFFVPKQGQSFMFDATQWHGVRPVTRGTRLSLLTSGTLDKRPPEGALFLDNGGEKGESN